MIARAALRALFCGIALFAAAAAAFAEASAPAMQQPISASPAPGTVADPAATDRILVMVRMAPPHFRPNQSYSGAYGDVTAQAMRHRIASAIARRNGLELLDGWPMPLLGVDCFVMRVPASRTVEDAIRQTRRDPLVAWSQPMQVYHGHGSAHAPNDPLFRLQPAADEWHLADLHRLATGRGISIAIVDSKIETTHPDLAGQFVSDRDFVGFGSSAEYHGTGIAGVIAAREGNGVGIAGIAPAARLMALRACWQTSSGETLCNSLSLARAMQFAIDHAANIINLSLSGPPDMLLEKLVGIAIARHTTVVAAFDPALPQGGFPAALPGVVPVIDESLPSWPNGVYGAPGRDVPTTRPGGKWYLVTGSSYAAAHVSGLVALARQERRSLPVSLSRKASGEVDACATLLRTTAACDCACAVDYRVAARR